MPNQTPTNSKKCPGCEARPDCNMWATKEFAPHCLHCATALGKRTKTTKETRSKQRDSHKKSNQVPQNTNPNTKSVNKKVLEAMYEVDFDLKEYFDYIKKADPGGVYYSAPKITAYSRWCFSDADTRIPKTREEVAEILDTAVSTLYRWEKGDVFRGARSEHLVKILDIGFGAEIRTMTLLDNASRGDVKSCELIQKIVEKRNKDDRRKSDPFAWMSPKDIEEAKSCEDVKFQPKENADKLAKEFITAKYVSGDIDENEVN